MELCTLQCLHRTLHAVLIGISPIVLCLFLLAIARLILHCVELFYNRRQKRIDYRRSSSIFFQTGRSTLSYTPVSIIELQRIIQGKYDTEQQQQQQNDSSSSLLKSMSNRHEPSTSTTAIASLVIRRNALNTTPFTALFAPVSTPTIDIINEKRTHQPTITTNKHESIQTTTPLSSMNNDNNNHTIFYNTNDSWETEPIETDPLVTLSKTRTTTTTSRSTILIEEFHDFHSARSVPYSLNLANSLIEDEVLK